ncbi:cell division protein FtsX [Sphingomonas sp.]|uniref:cell division protein FtsX n=1 Tax=Sphingomonas sp. TaxID=28214 RepID=UPI002C9CB66C|nr:FtsX-like permease family protein [Sphingomonas sp.]HWK36120.1 FtsX-like permease family protein [Sphingomonas sp.]
MSAPAITNDVADRTEDDPATLLGISAGKRLLDDSRRARAMSWVMAVMLFLTVLAGALGLGTMGAARSLDRQLAGRLTVQLVGARDDAVSALADRLRAMPEVGAVRPVPRAELARLLEPWLGDAGLDADLPMPAMIDVDLHDPGDAAFDAVAGRVRAAAPQARVDRNAAWLAPVRSFVVSLAWLAGGLVLLMAGATTAIVLLTARAGLDTHRDTIEVLHMLGSTDIQVARLFQRRIALDTLIGGAVGTVCALATVAVIGTRIADLDSALTSGIGLSAVDWALLAGLPLLFALLAMAAARIAVVRALRQVL